jgi:cytochrome c oxidase assembly protein subunit 15
MSRFRISPRAYRWITLVAAILLALIIVTGAAVRLTGSGLGCPEWPNCTEGSLTPESSTDYHAMVEFVNRAITGLVSLGVMIAVLGSLVRLPRRRDLVWLSLGLVVGVIAQALLGALVVEKLLDPPFVMGHFLLSAVLLANAIWLYHRAGLPDDARSRPAFGTGPLWLGRLLVVAVSVVLVTGTVVTGAGPHSGDAGPDSDLRATRLDLAVPDVARIHGTSVMVFLALVLVTLAVMARRPGAHTVVKRLGLLLALVVAQAGIGYYQYFNGVPRVLVGFHVAGATAVFAATTAVLLAMYEPVRRRPGVDGKPDADGGAFNSGAAGADKEPWSVPPPAPVGSSRASSPPAS